MGGLFGHHIQKVKTIDGRELPELRENTAIKPLKYTFVMDTFMLQRKEISFGVAKNI